MSGPSSSHPGFPVLRLRQASRRRRRLSRPFLGGGAALLVALAVVFSGTTPAVATGAPVVTSVTPATGHMNTPVVISGSGFTGATSVTFGGLAAAFTVNSDISISATAPSRGPGTVDVIVTTPSGTSVVSAFDEFTYTGGPFPPSIASVTPSSGPTSGGTVVTISGDWFTGAVSVTFGGTAASFTIVDDTQLTATAPAHAAGVVDVVVTTYASSFITVNDQFTYVDPMPVVTSVSPSAGPAGTLVTVTGANFTGAAAVTFGGIASAFTLVDSTTLTATAPAGPVGAVDVIVTTPSGSSVLTAADQFTYPPPPAPFVTSLSPNSGPAGTTVTITGGFFTGAVGVSFGGSVAIPIVQNDTTLSVIAPLHLPLGPVQVQVTTPGGTSTPGIPSQYTYTASPALDCQVLGAPCTFTFAQSPNGFAFSGLWHWETNALGVPSLAYNTGCTGPLLQGCTFATGPLPNAGMAVSPLLNVGAARLLRFHTLRYPGDVNQCGIADRTRVLTSSDGGASFQELPLWSAGAGLYPNWPLGFGGPGGGDLCGTTNGTDTTSVAVVVPAGTTNIAFSFDTMTGDNNNAAGWFITDVSLTVPVVDGVDFWTSQFQWMPDSNLPWQPNARLVTGQERALVTTDSGTLVTIGLEQPLGGSSVGSRYQQPLTKPKNAPPVFPDLKPASQPTTTKSLQPASAAPPGTLTCTSGTTIPVISGIAQFQGCQVHAIGTYNWQVTTPPVGSLIPAPPFLIETPLDCNTGPCVLHVDSASEFPWLPGPSLTSAWHIEPNASVSGMSGPTVAFNTGCTGPGLAGCDYNQPSSGIAATRLLSPTTGPTQLEFKIARDTGGTCQQDDWLWAAYSTDGGWSWYYSLLQQGTISPGGQYISQWGYVCGNSTTAQTVRAPLPAGVTTVTFGFQTSGAFHGAGVFIDDVRIGSAAGTQLAFNQQPSGGATGVPLGTQPSVESRDAAGNHVYEDGVLVALSLINPDGSPAVGATLSCTSGNTRPMAAGFANFDGCKVTGTGTFRLRAVVDARQVDSNTFAVGAVLDCAQGQCTFNFSGSDHGFTFTGNLWHRETTAAPPNLNRPTLAFAQGCIDMFGIFGCNTYTGHPNYGVATSPRLNLGAARLLTFTSYLDTAGICDGRVTLMYSTDNGANFRDLDLWPNGGVTLLFGGLMNAGGGHYCSFGGSFRASIVLPAGTTNIAFMSTSSFGAGWFIDDITFSVPVAGQLWLQTPWGDWMPGVPFPDSRQPQVQVRTAEGALLTDDNSSVVTLSLLGPSLLLSPSGLAPGANPVNGPHLTPQRGPVPAPAPAGSSTRLGGIGAASQTLGALTCNSLTAVVSAGVARFSGCSVSQLGSNYQFAAALSSPGSPITGVVFGGNMFNIVTPRACSGAGGCSFNFDSTVEFSYPMPGLWHREAAAAVPGMAGGMLAYNSGCTGPGVAGCTFDLGGQEGPGYMVSPLLSMSSPSRLQFKVARDAGPFSVCGQEDRLNAWYSLDGGVGWWGIDFQGLHGTITSGGQYFNGWDICGNSATAQTVSVDLPAGVTNVIFGFQPWNQSDNGHAGVFIDDVRLTSRSYAPASQRTVYRLSDGSWFTHPNGVGIPWGNAGDIPVPGDYNGDGVKDIAVFRPSNGYWYMQSPYSATWWGMPGDQPLQGDFDGDGKADIAVYRPSNGYWYVINSHDSTVTATWWGISGDIPVPGDFDGDGKTDIAVLRPANGYWYIINSHDSSVTATWWAASGDVPVPGDYDGDGKADVAVYRPSNGYWYIIRSSDSGVTATWWGASGDIPEPGDYDGDGTTDIMVYRPSDGYWYQQSPYSATWWGIPGDIPVALPYIVRNAYYP